MDANNRGRRQSIIQNGRQRAVCEPRVTTRLGRGVGLDNGSLARLFASARSWSWTRPNSGHLSEAANIAPRQADVAGRHGTVGESFQSSRSREAARTVSYRPASISKRTAAASKHTYARRFAVSITSFSVNASLQCDAGALEAPLSKKAIERGQSNVSI